MRVVAWIVGIAVMAGIVGCGSDHTTVATTGAPAAASPAAELSDTCAASLVDAADVEIVGSLTADELDMVHWALGRYAEAGLRLPPVLEIAFDPTRVRCGGVRGLCLPDVDPPAVYVCEPDGDSAFRSLGRQMTLLHELGHIWFATSGVAAADIVGGTSEAAGNVAWSDRTAERVAVVLAWGLLDQPRRPVPTDVPCRELHRQFQALTGVVPLGPLEPLCVPTENA